MKPTGVVSWIAGFALALVLLGGVTWLNLSRASEAQESARLVERTHEVRYELRGLFATVREVETGMRGYVLTGAPEYLEPYQTGVKAVATRFERLRALITDPQLQQALTVLEPLVARAVELANHVVRLRRDVGLAAAQAEVATGQSRAAMRAVRAQLARMDQAEDQLLALRAAAAQSQAESARALTLGGSALSMALLIGVFALVLRENRLREQANNAVTAAAAELHRAFDAFEAMRDAMVMFAPDTLRFSFVNDGAVQLLGYSRQEWLTMTPLDIRPGVTETQYREMLAPLLNGQATSHVFTTVHRHKNGTEIPVEVVLQTVGEGAERCFVALSRDIRDRQRAEETVRASQRQLEEAGHANQLIMEHSLDVICTVDEQGRFAFVSAACENVWGYRPDELVGRQYIDFVEPEDHPNTNQAAADIMAGRAVRDFENRYRRKDGSLVPIAWSASWSPDEKKMFCVAHDITERKRTEEALRRAHDDLSVANAQLDQASRLKDEFLANMSHELRTPLNAILGLSEALLEQVGGTLTPRQQKSIATIASSGSHLLALINDILDLSKVEAGKLDLFAEPLNLVDFCQSCLVFVKTQAMQKNIAVSFERDEAPAVIQADPKRLKQVLVNLLTNAVKFTPHGGRVGLKVTAATDGDRVHLTVWDSGIGIAPEDQVKLFKAFSQVDSGLSRSQEGTGLGLVLVARLAELQGGSVAVESEPGRGSRFIVTLPLTAATSVGDWRSEDRRGYRKALVIEDDPSTGERLTQYLSELGVDSVLQVRGDSALEAARRECPDVILLDLQLPGESGWVVLARLKDDPRTACIPVVVVSVVDDPARSMAIGAVAHFTKPISRRQLADFFQRAGDQLKAATTTTEPRGSTGGPIVLLAEDNEANILTIGGYLEDKGYTLRYAANGAEAVALTRKVRPAVILMDIQMPVMDGLAAIRAIRAEADLQAIPIVALTALAMPGDRERCLDAGATDYMIKPVSLKALADLVGRLVPPPVEALP